MDSENNKYVRIFNKTKSEIMLEIEKITNKLNVVYLNFMKCIFEDQLNDIRTFLDEFHNLIDLELSNNSICVLNKNLFVNLEHLEIINLSSNGINIIPDDLFAKNLNLKVINFKKNLLPIIRSSIVSDLHRLELLDFSHNYIVNLEAYFVENENLAHIKLGYNMIYFISDLTFHKVPNLRNLELNNNHIPRVNSKLFAKIPNLQYLFLNDNLITYISTKAFANLLNLKCLYLQDNLITSIDNRFLNNAHLVALDLGNNDIHSIETNTFKNNLNLEYLRLVVVRQFEANSIDYLRKLITFELVYEIDKNGLILMELIGVLVNKPHLTILRIFYKHCYQYASIMRFNVLPSLQSLHIECLNADKEQIIKINLSAQLSRMVNLKSLVLKNLNLFNVIRPRKGPFQNLRSLKELNLTGLKNAFLSDMFSEYPFLEYLNLSFSEISVIDDDAFGSLTQLIYFYMENSKLMHVSVKLFRNNTMLRVINLAKNKIETIEDCSFKTLKYLELLDLRGNLLTGVSSKAYNGLNEGAVMLITI